MRRIGVWMTFVVAPDQERDAMTACMDMMQPSGTSEEGKAATREFARGGR